MSRKNKNRPANFNQAWAIDEVMRVFNDRSKGKPVKATAKSLGRTVASVMNIRTLLNKGEEYLLTVDRCDVDDMQKYFQKQCEVGAGTSEALVEVLRNASSYWMSFSEETDEEEVKLEESNDLKGLEEANETFMSAVVKFIVSEVNKRVAVFKKGYEDKIALLEADNEKLRAELGRVSQVAHKNPFISSLSKELES